MAKNLPKKLSSWLVPRLRRISMWWPGVNIARERAKLFLLVGYHKNGNPHYKRYYVCQNPDCGLLCSDAREGAVDHIDPVVDPRLGFDGENWNDYIPSLLCHPDELQFLCHTCHDIKTHIENEIRTLNRKKS